MKMVASIADPAAGQHVADERRTQMQIFREAIVLLGSFLVLCWTLLFFWFIWLLNRYDKVGREFFETDSNEEEEDDDNA